MEKKVSIDGTPLSQFTTMRGNELEHVVVLDPGVHTISAKYSTTAIGFNDNQNFKTPKQIDSEIQLDAGYEYTISVYFYTPEERKQYNEGNTGKEVFVQELEVQGFGAYNKAYIICYKEKEIN